MKTIDSLLAELRASEAAVSDLRNSIFGFAQYLHAIDHAAPIMDCHQGICPGVRGLLRRTQDACGETDTAVYVRATE